MSMTDSKAIKQQSVRDRIPLFASQEGIWEGVYRHYDASGNKIDEHKSRLIYRIIENDPYPFRQTNYYFWSDGRQEVRDISAVIVNQRICWETDLIIGWAEELHIDDLKRAAITHWIRKDDVDLEMYGTIQLSECGQYRTGVGQWLKNGKAIQRTFIDEHRISYKWDDE